MQNQEPLWQAVQARDRSRDGDFVYAVRTTGIFCRPSCPSRSKRRENVRFYPDAEAARQDGFRPCLRCRPEGEGDARAVRAIAEACASLDSADGEPDLAVLAARAGYSKWHFLRLFRDRVGITPKQYALARRKERLRASLPTARSVTEAIYAAGFNAASRAYADKAALGMPARTLRRGAEGETIRYGEAQSSLGPVTVAASARGVCRIEFGCVEDILPRIAARFPKARLEPADEGLAAQLAAVIALVDRPAAGDTGLSLDIRGTAFQERVWQALAAIPPGRTVSYADLAERIGRPGAARAVARACADNGLAVAIPCHRVVRGDGALSGYRWGVERKAALLRREAAED